MSTSDSCPRDTIPESVMRRIAQIEASLGVELFERRQSGYVPTPNGVSVADTAERVIAGEHRDSLTVAGVLKLGCLLSTGAL